MPLKDPSDRAVIRVVVKMTKAEQKALKAHCDAEVRTVGSWFRQQVRTAYAKRRKNARQAKTFQRNSDDGIHRGVDVWARLTEDERDMLEVLCNDEGVSVSIWFRRRLPR